MRATGRLVSSAAAGIAICTAAAIGGTDVGVGDEAPLYDTVDENMEPVSMADEIDGRPLVLVVSSAS
jgi:hypothetical protein